MLRGLKPTRVLQRAQNRKSTKAFGFLSAQIIWYWGVLVLYKKMDFARSWHWKNEKPGPTKAWTQYWQNNFSSRRGDHNTVHHLSVIGTLRFATTDGWTRVARCLGDWIEYGALWRVVARKLKLSCYTTNYVLREIAAVEFTLKMSFQKVRDDDFLNSAKSIHKTGLRT